MYVVVKGDFRFGITDVIGPFETQDEIWESDLMDVYPQEIYEVSPSPSGCDLKVGSGVLIEFCDRYKGKIQRVEGPYDHLPVKHNIQSVNQYAGLESIRPTKKVLHQEKIIAIGGVGVFVKEVYADVPVVEEADILSPKDDILREMVISKQKDRWGLDNSVLFVDPRGSYAS